MISIKDSSNNVQPVKSTLSGGAHVTHHNVDTSALPTGAATEAAVQAAITILSAQAALTDEQPVGITDCSADLATQTTQAVILAGVQQLVLTTSPIKGSVASTDTADHEIIAAPGAGTRINVTSLILTNTSGSPTVVTVKSGGNAVFPINLPAAATVIVTFNAPVPLVLNENENLSFTCSSGVSTVTLFANGYTSAV
jgi:hypothetical protein